MAVALVVLPAIAIAQQSVDPARAGIFAAAALPGWGLAVDVQRGTLFGALYGYDAKGAATFVTLLGDDAGQPLSNSFHGQVFATNASGQNTETIGDFLLSYGKAEGNSALDLQLNTEFIDGQYRFGRFGFADQDPLGVVANRNISVVNTDAVNDAIVAVKRYRFGAARGSLADGTVTQVGDTHSGDDAMAWIDSSGEMFIRTTTFMQRDFDFTCVMTHFGCSGATRVVVQPQNAEIQNGPAFAIVESESDPTRAVDRSRSGIFIADQLPGWGITVDVQRGLLFAPLFGYRADGAAVFLVLQGDDNMNGRYTGEVYLSTENGMTVRAIGQFDLAYRPQSGNPALVLDISSEVIEQSIEFERFGFGDIDPLAVVERRRLWVNHVDDASDGSSAAIYVFGAGRTTNDQGQPAVLGLRQNPGRENTVVMAFVDPATQLLIIEGDASAATRIRLSCTMTHFGCTGRFDLRADSGSAISTGTFYATTFQESG